jgi:hypothetical protein
MVVHTNPGVHDQEVTAMSTSTPTSAITETQGFEPSAITPIRPSQSTIEGAAQSGRRTFGLRRPSRRTFGWKHPSRRTFSFRRP